MKTFHILVIALVFSSTTAFSQSPTELFKKVKEYYNKHVKATFKSTLEYNRAEKMINYSSYNFPLKDVKILYLEINGSHVVTFNCDSCILSLDKYNRTEYSNGIGIEFNSKEECYRFIDLLAELREKI